MSEEQLLESLFDYHPTRAFRHDFIVPSLGVPNCEVRLDQAKGFAGKTVIDPTHVAVVRAGSGITHRQYCDAMDIVGDDVVGGVMGNEYAYKVNEVKAHRAWADCVQRRAHVPGVVNPKVTFIYFFEASIRAQPHAADPARSPSTRACGTAPGPAEADRSLVGVAAR